VGSCIDPLAPQAEHSFKDPDRSRYVGCITPPQTWHLTSVSTKVAANRPQLVHAPAGFGFLRAGTVSSPFAISKPITIPPSTIGLAYVSD
jgi:hypothetical protein